MSKSNDNVAYLPHAVNNQDATPPAKDIDPLSDDEQHFIETYRRLSRQDRTRVQRLLLRKLQDQQQ